MANLVGKHQIRYRDVDGTKAVSPVQIPARVEVADPEFVHFASLGTDSWELHVGETLQKMVKHASANVAAHSDAMVIISGLDVIQFKRGLLQWSSHRLDIGFSYEAIRAGKVVKTGEVEASGKGSGTEFGLLTYIPILGNINFDKGMELAMSRCLSNAIKELAMQIDRQ